MKFKTTLWIALITCVTLRVGAAQHTDANVMVEITFKAGRPHADPFKQLNLDVVFTDPAGTQKTVPAFWAGADAVSFGFCLALCGGGILYWSSGSS